MLDLRMVSDRMDEIRERLSLRGEIAGLDRLAELADQRRARIHEVETLRHQQKAAGAKMKELVKANPDGAAKLRADLKAASDRQKELDAELKQVEAELNDLLLEIPNLPHEAVPPGQAMIRTSYTATHTDEQLDRVVEVIARIGREKGLIS